MFIEAKDDGGGGDNWSYKSCKAAVKSSPPTNQHPVFLQAGCDPTAESEYSSAVTPPTASDGGRTPAAQSGTREAPQVVAYQKKKTGHHICILVNSV